MKARGLSKKLAVALMSTIWMFALAALSPFLVAGQQSEISSDLAYEHVEFLTGIAPRFAGTEAEAVAASYIENEFRSHGLETWVENFFIEDSYTIEENNLRVVSPEQIDLAFIPIAYSPSAENVAGDLVRVVDVSGDLGQLDGRVVLVGRENLDDLLELTDISPLAVLTYFENWPPYSEIWELPLEVPVLWISGDDAQHLIELLGQGEVEVEIQFKAKIENVTSYNVAALLPGQSEEIIVVGAHHDSVLTPGAVDDASGVAVVLEIARVLSTENLLRTVLFVTFGGEELGLFGSADFVLRHLENEIVAAVIFDSIAPGPENGMRVGLKGSSQYATTDWLDAYVQELAQNLGFFAQAEYVYDVGGYSDHVSFTNMEIPATWIYWINPEHDEMIWPIHTLADNLDAIDKTRLEQVASFGVELVSQLAWADLEAIQRAYELPLIIAAFAVVSAGAMVLSITMGSFLHYKRGWNWPQAAWVFSIITAAAVILAYLLLLA